MDNVKKTRATNTGKPKPIPTAWGPLINAYLDYLAAGGHPRTTINTRRSHLARVARAMRCEPSEVTKEQFVGWFGQQTWETETRRSYRTTLRGFYQWGYRHRYVADDLSYYLPRVKARKPMPRPTPEDVRQEAIDSADERLTVMLELADHGLRRAEVSKVSTDDLIAHGPSGARLLVHGKGNKRRVIPISDKLATMISAGAAGHTRGASSRGYLFPGNDGGHLSPRWVGTLCARALPGIWTMHSLRHRNATRAYQATNDIVAVSEILGHESIATTQMYVLSEEDRVRRAMLAAVS